MQIAAKKEINRQMEEMFSSEFKDFDDNSQLNKLIDRQSKKLKAADWAK